MEYKKITKRFFSKIEFTDSCWNWKLSLDKDGYGQFWPIHSKKVSSHRFCYELLEGKIPDEMVIDHLCKNKKCCNPAHLDIVTSKENNRRGINYNILKTHCKNGHKYDMIDNRNGRYCSICVNKLAIINRNKRKLLTVI